MGKITINQDSLKTSREWKRHKIQDGSNVFRILPPYGDVEVHKNYPYRKWSVAWLINPRTGNRSPFASPLTDGNENCPVKEYQDALKAYVDKKKATLEAQGLPKDKVKEELKSLYEIQWNIKVQHLYAYNAVDKSGNVGLLEIKSTAHKAMKKKMMEYIEKYGQDPTSLNSDLREDSGVWFNITKDGVGKNTEYDVKFSQTSAKDEDGELVFKNDRAALPETVVENFKDLAYDLNAVYRRKSYDELREILLYTLAAIAEDCPEAVLPGFEVDSVPTPVETPSQEEEVVHTGRTVNLNLSGDDDDDDDVAPVATKSAPAAAAASGDIADIQSFADSILGD